mgnify:FL=1|tara:strand:+ start:920 stop:1534 length:615 start_codon:yes stop_codon:yes gene_type:complete
MLSKFSNLLEAGIDEAGRGPLCGPVYASAVIWDTSLETADEISLIKDSKKLTSKRREKAYNFLRTNLKYYGVGYASNEEIDQINILQATKLAMQRAINNLEKKLPNNKELEFLIIDGVRWENCFNIPTESIIKGDNKYYSISAASIIAKEEHDLHIINYIKKNPEIGEKYDLLNNKGYGTKKHLLGLEQYGSSDFHRKTFKRCY